MKLSKLAIFTLSLMLSCSKAEKESGLELPQALISESHSLSDRLEYAYRTDQYDRALMTEKDLLDLLQKRSNPLLDSMDVRDSVRMEFVWTVYEAGELKTCFDHFHAGVVFLHGGGPNYDLPEISPLYTRDLLQIAGKDSACNEIRNDIQYFFEEAERRIEFERAGRKTKEEGSQFEIIPLLPLPGSDSL